MACSAVSQAGATWTPEVATLPFSAVTALLFLDAVLLIGGSEGLAYSYDQGATWQRAEVEDGMVAVTALAASPDFASNQTAIAATLGQGIVRTSDGGRTWTNASFGLESLEINTLVWQTDTAVLAATDDGIYRSRDAGRAWRRVYTSEESEVVALAHRPDNEIVAALANGHLLHSSHDGTRWSYLIQSQPGIQVLSLFITPAGTLLLSTLEHGILRSEDAGTSWQVVYRQVVHTHAYAQETGTIYAGTERGVSVSTDDGLTWQELPSPPLHDLHTLLVCGKDLLLCGTYAGLVRLTSGSGWEPLPDIPQPLTACVPGPDNTLLISGAVGLLRLSLVDGTRRMLLVGETGQLAHITLCPGETNWHIWVASADGARLLHSDDGGASWQQLPPPFGVLPLVALQAVADRLLAATYDPRQHRICLWYSTDDGKNWIRSMEATTDWPIVATCKQPAALSIAHWLFLEQAVGKWQQVTVGSNGGAIRRVLSIQSAGKTLLLVLTTTGIWRSADIGQTWQQVYSDLPIAHIVDIAVMDTDLIVLLSGGRLWRFHLQEMSEEESA